MTLDEIFEAFKSKTVLVIGDVMVDSYVYGKVKRISPEAPVPVLNVTCREKRLGGAANVAANIKSLGATPILCSVIGDDPDGEAFHEILDREAMPRKGIIKSSTRITTTKHRILSSSQHLLRVDSEDTHPLSELDRKSLIGHVKNLMKEADLIIFEDYDKGTLSREFIGEIIDEANKVGLPTAVDPKKHNFLHYKGATLFKPNFKELKEGLGVEIEHVSLENLSSATELLHKEISAENYLITLSEHGIFYRHQESTGIYPAHLRSIADVSGAGDTVISIAGLAMTLGFPIDFVAELSNLGGGIVCEFPGVIPIDPETLKEEARNNSIIRTFID